LSLGWAGLLGGISSQKTRESKLQNIMDPLLDILSQIIKIIIESGEEGIHIL
jgi:hypothetical protein